MAEQGKRKAARPSVTNSESPFERLMTLAEVGEVLGKTTAAVRRMVQRAQLPAVRLGRGFRVKPSQLAAFLNDLPEVVPQHLMRPVVNWQR
jgi:excisionase family DNA binding protein